MSARWQPRLPSRYEDHDLAFRGRLHRIPSLISLVQQAYASMKVSGGIRFLPVYGKSGSGKTSAARELGTHMPEAAVVELEREAIMSRERLLERLRTVQTRRPPPDLTIAVVDQYEEAVAERTAIPTQFVEQLSLLDREELRDQPTLFIWLTTSQAFQRSLANTTSRNARILASHDYELRGPASDDWPSIIEETFDFHNEDKTLADFEILSGDLEEVSIEGETLGQAIELIGERLASRLEPFKTFPSTAS